MGNKITGPGRQREEVSVAIMQGWWLGYTVSFVAFPKQSACDSVFLRDTLLARDGGCKGLMVQPLPTMIRLMITLPLCPALVYNLCI